MQQPPGIGDTSSNIKWSPQRVQDMRGDFKRICSEGSGEERGIKSIVPVGFGAPECRGKSAVYDYVELRFPLISGRVRRRGQKRNAPKKQEYEDLQRSRRR